MTPKRPDATCFMRLERESPFASGENLVGSSPPSPVLLLAPRRFIATAIVSWASLEIDPREIAPVANRLTISVAGSTSSRGTLSRLSNANSSSDRIVRFEPDSEFEASSNCSNMLASLRVAASWSRAIVSGFQRCRSPVPRHR